MAKSKREERKWKIQNARKKAEEHSTGGSSCIKLPEGVSFFSVKQEGSKKIDIIGYVVGEGNPHADEGMLHYERTYYVHRNVGPNNDTYVCAARTFKKPCPVCEYRAKVIKDSDLVPDGEDPEKFAQALAPKERQLFNVIDADNRDAGIQVWDFSYHLFGKILDEEMKDPDNEGYIEFFTPDNGFRLKIRFSENTFGGRKFYETSKIEFLPRKPLDDSVVEEAVSLDEVIVEPDYDELKRIFLGGDVESEAPSKTKKKPSKDDDENDDSDSDDDTDSDDSDDDEPEEKPRKKKGGKTAKQVGLKKKDIIIWKGKEVEVVGISDDGTTVELEEEDGKVHEDVEVDGMKFKKVEVADDADDDSDDDEPKPSESKKKPGKKPSKYDEDEDEDEDDEGDSDLEPDDEEDDEPDDEDSSDLEPDDDEDEDEDEDEEEEKPRKRGRR